MKFLEKLLLFLMAAIVFTTDDLVQQFQNPDELPVVVAQPVDRYNYNNAGEHATWQPGQVVTVYIDPVVTPETKAGITAAISNWNQAGVVKLVSTDDVNQANIRVINSQINKLDSIVFGRTQLAQNDQGQLTHGVILINNQAIAEHHNIDGPKSIQAYTDMVCTHEMGHVLGLNHVTRGTNSVMQPGTDRNMQPYDIQRVQMLYNQK